MLILTRSNIHTPPILFLAIIICKIAFSASFTITRRSPFSIFDLSLQTKKLSPLFLSSGDDGGSVRFLGKGERAVVRPGVVLVAPNHEYNHFLMRSAVFVHAIGLDEFGEHVTRGVIIDHPTAFTMGEMGGGSINGVLGNNILFQGGDAGNDAAILLHSCGGGGGAENSEENGIEIANSGGAPKIDCGAMIGTSGIFEGGVQAAMDLANEGLVDPEKFKFFFNFVQFSDKELKNMLAAADSDGDAWASLEVAPDIILNNDFSRGGAWSYLRNQLKQLE